jgi:hypothetical protein
MPFPIKKKKVTRLFVQFGFAGQGPQHSPPCPNNFRLGISDHYQDSVRIH